jgi:thiol-disulfide isomerase/thioredoxin
MNRLPLNVPISQPSTGGMFSRMMSAGGNLTSNKWLIISAVLLFVVVAIACFYYYAMPSMNTKYKPNSEITSIDDKTKSAELLFFFADWCPHCKAAKPVWNDLKAQYENKTVKGYTIVFTEIDCSEETAESEKMINQYSVEGYPTIKLLKDGQVIEYDAKPSTETLTKFLNTVL